MQNNSVITADFTNRTFGACNKTCNVLSYEHHNTKLRIALILYRRTCAPRNACSALVCCTPLTSQLGDLQLADTHKQWQPVHCTPKLMYKKIDTQRNTKTSQTPRCPTMARHPVSGASCVPCVENQTLGKTRLHKRSGSNHCPMRKQILHQNVQNPCSEICLLKKKKKTFQKTVKQA